MALSIDEINTVTDKWYSKTLIFQSEHRGTAASIKTLQLLDLSPFHLKVHRVNYVEGLPP